MPTVVCTRARAQIRTRAPVFHTHNELICQGHSEEDLENLQIDELMTRMAAWLASARSDATATPR